MSNYIEYKDRVAFHPGYYIEEIVEESGLTQQDFANRLDTTPKNLSKLINGQQSLSVEMAMKLSRMLGTSLEYWLNIQNAYDIALAEKASDARMKEEVVVLRELGYTYFRDNFQLPNLPRKLEEQVVQVRQFLGLASLTVLRNPNLSTSLNGGNIKLEEEALVKSNALVQIAMNEARKKDAPKFDRNKFEASIDYALTQTTNRNGFYPLVENAFLDAGVILVTLPNLSGSKTNGVTKRMNSNIMLMVNSQHRYTSSFWFTLLHEAGRILNGDLGFSLENEAGKKESAANNFAKEKLVPKEAYEYFVLQGVFNLDSIKSFSHKIDRDPGIVLKRLQDDKHVSRNDRSLSGLDYQYEFVSDF